jgi:hypothetical protein
MIDWYGVVVGATVNSQSNNIAFISNDHTHHRIALLAIPGLWELSLPAQEARIADFISRKSKQSQLRPTREAKQEF